MKTVLIFALLAVVLTSTLVNTEEEIRERRQTVEQCQQTVLDNQDSINFVLTQIATVCDDTCTSSCKSVLNTIKDTIGCCLDKFSPGFAGLNVAYELCDIPPPSGCSSASGILANFSVITFIAIIYYYVN